MRTAPTAIRHGRFSDALNTRLTSSRRIDSPTNSLICFSESSPPIMRKWQ